MCTNVGIGPMRQLGQLKCMFGICRIDDKDHERQEKVSAHGHTFFSFIVTRLGYFWKFLATQLLTKVAQIFYFSLGYFVKHHCFVSTTLATFWASFGKYWATFCFYIWSRWLTEPAALVPYLLLGM